MSLRLMPPACPGVEMCGSTATSTTSVPTGRYAPTAVPFHSPSARSTTKSSSKSNNSNNKSNNSNHGNNSNHSNSSNNSNHTANSNKHSTARGDPRGIEPGTFSDMGWCLSFKNAYKYEVRS